MPLKADMTLGKLAMRFFSFFQNEGINHILISNSKMTHRLVVYTPNEDTEFTVVHCSAAFSRFTGIVSDDLVGQSVEYLFKDTIRIDDNKRTIVSIDMKEANENKVPKSFVLNIIPLEKHSYFYILDFKGLCDTLSTNAIDDNLWNRVVG